MLEMGDDLELLCDEAVRFEAIASGKQKPTNTGAEIPILVRLDYERAAALLRGQIAICNRLDRLLEPDSSD